MDFREIKTILEFMEQNKLVEFEYEENGKRIKLRKGEEAPARILTAVPAAAPANPTPAPAPAAARTSNVAEFKSPLVGTFYRSPKPGSPPFVREGEEVKADKVLCIIEAMKVMNEIKAPFDGKIVEVVAKDGQAVEYGATLFLIEKKS
jgi:acetyl-CoA carboxylase biotin carboxyl carrier protein